MNMFASARRRRKVISWRRSGYCSATRIRIARSDVTQCPRMISGCRSCNHDSIALSAAINTGSTAHSVSSKSKLKTRGSGTFIDKAWTVRIPHMNPVLLIGSKNYSSWSLRPWLFLRKVGFEFQEQIIYFDASDYQAQIDAQC